MQRDINKGDVPVLVLAVLADAPSHGYALAREIERRSGQALKMKEGTLYPALRVLEQNGLIEGRWEIQSSGPARKIYSLTVSGSEELARRKQDWSSYTKAFSVVVGLTKGGEDVQPA